MTAAPDHEQAAAYEAMTTAQKTFRGEPTLDHMRDVLEKTRLYLLSAGFSEDAVDQAGRTASKHMVAYRSHGAPMPSLGRLISEQEPRTDAAE
jgi:hypothetical protein